MSAGYTSVQARPVGKDELISAARKAHIVKLWHGDGWSECSRHDVIYRAERLGSDETIRLSKYDKSNYKGYLIYVG